MARGSRTGRGGGRIGGRNAPPNPPPPVFRTPEERRRWVASEGARKRAARRWTNRGLTPPPKLARYADYGEGSCGGCRPWSSPPPNSSDDSSDDDAAAAMVVDFGDYAHDGEEEEAAIQRAIALSAAEARAAWRREEAEAVRQVRAYEAARKEAAVRRVKRELVVLDDE